MYETVQQPVIGEQHLYWYIELEDRDTHERALLPILDEWGEFCQMARVLSDLYGVGFVHCYSLVVTALGPEHVLNQVLVETGST